MALAKGCQIVDDAGEVTFDSPECVDALRWYGDLARNYSVEGAQDVDSTRGTYFAGRAAMMFWSPFLLDGMAGLRADTKPSCPECKKNPAFLAKNSGLVGPLSGDGGEPSQFGQVSTFGISVGAPTEDAQALVEYMMTDGYIALARRCRRRASTRCARATRGPGEVQDRMGRARERRGHEGAAEQVLRKASIDSLGDGVENFQRWGFAQGQGAADRRARR